MEPREAMLKANKKPSRSSLSRCRPFCVTLACLVLSGIFLSCHPTRERDADSAMGGRSLRPIDADPQRAEIIGRVALAKIGYLPIMRLAREAGWVTRKKRESARRSDPALLAQAAGAGGFVDVFSRYAVVAGVTSQADSPLPGPADAVAIGIIVIGLIDAGLLAGAILRAVGDAATTTTVTTTSSPPIATAMPMATAAPTTTAKPVPVTATRDETEKERKERCLKVKKECVNECRPYLNTGDPSGNPFHKCFRMCLEAADCWGVKF